MASYILPTALLAMLVVITVNGSVDPTEYNPEVVYQWNIVEYEWSNKSVKDEEISSGRYEPRNSSINGIKVYKGKVYVTVPRLKPGVPSTLNVIVPNTNPNLTSSSFVLRPYPNWEMQRQQDCSALQLVQSMEIDPNTGYMWIVDTGFVPGMYNQDVQPVDACAAKIVIWDIGNNQEVQRYEFPRLVVGYGMFYLNDIVLDYFNESARYAYMSDTLDYKLVVYDYVLNISYSYTHPSMDADKQHENITISNMTLTGLITGINGIAISPDFRYVYYSSLAGVGLFQIETSVLRTGEGNSGLFAGAVRHLGDKASPGDGMAYGARNNLYYSALEKNAVYKWDISQDLNDDSDFDHVSFTSQSPLVTDSRMDWIDTLAIDDSGYLWFTTSRLNKHFSEDGISHAEPNFLIWKVFVNDYNYMNSTWNKGGPTSGTSGWFVSPPILPCMLIIVTSLYMDTSLWLIH